jgi:hypothetical protein
MQNASGALNSPHPMVDPADARLSKSRSELQLIKSSLCPCRREFVMALIFADSAIPSGMANDLNSGKR